MAGWVLGMMVPFWFALKLLGVLRVPAEQEALGPTCSLSLSLMRMRRKPNSLRPNQKGTIMPSTQHPWP